MKLSANPSGYRQVRERIYSGSKMHRVLCRLGEICSAQSGSTVLLNKMLVYFSFYMLVGRR